MEIDVGQALRMLLEGNRHFATGTLFHPHQGMDRRREVAGGQKPFAAVLSCIDSRVPPEMVFDVGLGDLLVVRVAGNVLDDLVLGSIEFGVREFGIPLIVVLGHQRCGAVTAAVNAIKTESAAEGHVGAIVEAMRPSIQVAGATADGGVDAAVRANISLVAGWLRASEPVLADAVRAGELSVVGLYYSLDTAGVEVIE